MSIRDEIVAHLTAALAQSPAYRLTITGHSLGAAIASLAGADLRSRGFDVAVYTYGQPRTGNQAYADYIDAKLPFQPGSGHNNNTMARATHANDGVAQVPAEKEGYRHHATEYWIAPDEAAVWMCMGQEPKECNQREWGYPLNGPHFSYFGVSVANPLDKHAGCVGHDG